MSASLDGSVRVDDLVRCVNFRTLTPPNKDDCMRFLNELLADDDAKELEHSAADSALHLAGQRWRAQHIMADCEEPFQVYLWSLRTGRCLDVLCGHEGPVSYLVFCCS